MYQIEATIYTLRESQRNKERKKGKMLKRIGTLTRQFWRKILEKS